MCLHPAHNARCLIIDNDVKVELRAHAKSKDLIVTDAPYQKVKVELLFTIFIFKFPSCFAALTAGTTMILNGIHGSKRLG